MHQNQFQGLSQAQVEERRQKGLTNQVTISTERTTWQIVRSNIFTYFNKPKRRGSRSARIRQSLSANP